MLIGSNLNNDFGPLQGTPWTMEPPRPPPNTTALQTSNNMELSPAG